jgi:hypothetical protein
MIYLTSNILGVQKTGINLINRFYILIYMQNKSGSGMAVIFFSLLRFTKLNLINTGLNQ